MGPLGICFKNYYTHILNIIIHQLLVTASIDKCFPVLFFQCFKQKLWARGKDFSTYGNHMQSFFYFQPNLTEKKKNNQKHFHFPCNIFN
jgi:hypothetical protein